MLTELWPMKAEMAPQPRLERWPAGRRPGAGRAHFQPFVRVLLEHLGRELLDRDGTPIRTAELRRLPRAPIRPIKDRVRGSQCERLIPGVARLVVRPQPFIELRLRLRCPPSARSGASIAYATDDTRSANTANANAKNSKRIVRRPRARIAGATVPGEANEPPQGRRWMSPTSLAGIFPDCGWITCVAVRV